MTRSTLTRLPILLAFAAVASAANSQSLQNRGFETGVATWQVFGDVSTQPGGTEAGAQLWLTTASLLDVDDAPLAAGALNRSGVTAGAVAVPAGLEAFVGLGIGAIDPDPANVVMAFEGSAVRQTFTADAGSVLSFDWDFGTSDPGADYAFVVVDGVLTRLAGSGQATLPGTLGNALRTGFANLSITLSAGGVHDVAFGVVDVNDYIVTSTLAVDNLQLTSAVPEVSAPWLALAGLASLAAMRKGRRR